eukprot:SRR837773.5725.p2 GENE.SRR837773.5725~~SRR837773.5725.p2  ORF type:complete len:268 (-),score=108.63 SRR837773.5725:10-714(-)
MSQEKQRTHSRWGNLINYGFQICLKGLPFRDKEYVRDFARALHNGTGDAAPLIFRERSDGEEAAENEPKLVGNPQVLIVLNIPNCYGGFCRFWEAAGAAGVEPSADPELLKRDLDPADGKLEVLTYSSILVDPAVAVTRLPVKNMSAKRVFSGAPLFMQYQDDEEYDVYVHVQIDGEFFKLQNPTSTTFEFHRKIRVLHSQGLFFAQPSAEASAGEDSQSEAGSIDSISEEAER